MPPITGSQEAARVPGIGGLHEPLTPLPAGLAAAARKWPHLAALPGARAENHGHSVPVKDSATEATSKALHIGDNNISLFSLRTFAPSVYPREGTDADDNDTMQKGL